MEGTIIHLAVEYLPGNRTPKPGWLWLSHPRAKTSDIVDAVEVVLASRYHAGVVTSDRSDLEILAAALPVTLNVYDV